MNLAQLTLSTFASPLVLIMLSQYERLFALPGHGCGPSVFWESGARNASLWTNPTLLKLLLALAPLPLQAVSRRARNRSRLAPAKRCLQYSKMRFFTFFLRAFHR